ncbi:hypothetical protein JCM1841_000124 [Sporobolomyces salmonicolor]
MLLQAGADESLWAEALLAFVFVKNRSHHAALNSKVPLAVWRGRPVRVDMLRVWGCRARHILSRTKSKLDAQAVPLVFVSYDGDTKAYRLLNPKSQPIVRSCDTRFQEDLLPSPLPHLPPLSMPSHQTLQQLLPTTLPSVSLLTALLSPLS